MLIALSCSELESGNHLRGKEPMKASQSSQMTSTPLAAHSPAQVDYSRLVRSHFRPALNEWVILGAVSRRIKTPLQLIKGCWWHPPALGPSTEEECVWFVKVLIAELDTALGLRKHALAAASEPPAVLPQACCFWESYFSQAAEPGLCHLKPLSFCGHACGWFSGRN